MLFNEAWVIGFLMDISGAMLMLQGLSLAPVSVIQPVSGCGLAILSIFSHFYLKEMMNAIDWVGITLAGIGTTGNIMLTVNGVLAGMLVLGKRLPSAPIARLWFLLGWVLIIIGVVLLVSSARLAAISSKAMATINTSRC